jgi:hypothetical protein
MSRLQGLGRDEVTRIEIITDEMHQQDRMVWRSQVGSSRLDNPLNISQLNKYPTSPATILLRQSKG